MNLFVDTCCSTVVQAPFPFTRTRRTTTLKAVRPPESQAVSRTQRECHTPEGGRKLLPRELLSVFKTQFVQIEDSAMEIDLQTVEIGFHYGTPLRQYFTFVQTLPALALARIASTMTFAR